jgi:YggT family protein
MLAQALLFLIDTFLGLFAAVLLVRFYLQVMRAPARNPLSHFVLAVTDWIVRPARRVIPGWAGLDLSTLVLAWATEFLLLVASRLVQMTVLDDLPMPVAGFALLAVVAIIRTSLYILMGALILQAVLSWVAPHSPVAPVLNGLVRPFLRPIQQRVPPVGNVDLSPLLLIVAVQLVLMLLIPWLGGLVAGLLGG